MNILIISNSGNFLLDYIDSISSYNVSDVLIDETEHSAIECSVCKELENRSIKIHSKINTCYSLNLYLIVLLHYTKKIFTKEFSCKKIINYHSGLLPNFRGMHPNMWNFLNEKYNDIGYTVHYVNDNYDDGDIIMKKQILINENQNYEFVVDSIKNDILINSDFVIKHALDSFVLEENISDEICFYTKFKNNDGIITDFTLPGKFYYRLYLLFNEHIKMYFLLNKMYIEFRVINFVHHNHRKGFIKLGVISREENGLYYVTVVDGYIIIKLFHLLKLGTEFDGSKFHHIN